MRRRSGGLGREAGHAHDPDRVRGRERPGGPRLVASLAHPGGNATGVISSAESLAPKRLELLHEILPGAKRVGFLSDPTEPMSAGDRTRLALAATALGLTIVGRNVERRSSWMLP